MICLNMDLPCRAVYLLVQRLLFQHITGKDLHHQLGNEIAVWDLLCSFIGWLEVPLEVPTIHFI